MTRFRYGKKHTWMVFTLLFLQSNPTYFYHMLRVWNDTPFPIGVTQEWVWRAVHGKIPVLFYPQTLWKLPPTSCCLWSAVDRVAVTLVTRQALIPLLLPVVGKLGHNGCLALILLALLWLSSWHNTLLSKVCHYIPSLLPGEKMTRDDTAPCRSCNIIITINLFNTLANQCLCLRFHTFHKTKLMRGSALSGSLGTV